MAKHQHVAPRVVVWLVAIVVSPVGAAQESLRRDVWGPLHDAFRDVVLEPSKSTVQVYCNGSTACLGAVVRSDGIIVTKASELKGTTKVRFSTDKQDQKRDATIIGIDPATDLAVLKIDAHNLPVVPWTTQGSPPVGTWLATLGLSKEYPVLSVGILSVAARRIPSGAALGVGLDEVEGLARITVKPGMAADKSGMRDGDVVRKVEGEAITGVERLKQAIQSHLPGDKISVTVERQGKLLTLEPTLGEMSEMIQDGRAEFQNKLGGTLSERRNCFPLAIQHDSVLRPSECGGPIVDIDGKVVGLNIARAGRVESYALPTSLVRETVDKLLKTELTSAAAVDGSLGRKAQRVKNDSRWASGMWVGLLSGR